MSMYVRSGKGVCMLGEEWEGCVHARWVRHVQMKFIHRERRENMWEGGGGLLSNSAATNNLYLFQSVDLLNCMAFN